MSGNRLLLAVGLPFLIAAAACTDSPSDPGQVTDPAVLAPVAGIPEAWTGSSGTQTISLTTVDKRSGSTALLLTGPASGLIASATTAVLSQSIRADGYRGKRVRFSAWVKPLGVSESQYSGVWMRIDALGATVGFDNMYGRGVSGSGDWRQIAIVLDVPSNAVGIALGMLYNARNSMLVDDLAFEVVGANVPPTAPLLNTPSSVDSETVAITYARSPSVPVNLDFEGLAGPSAGTIDWMSHHVVPLATTDPSSSLDDLEPLRAMIGSAHVVGLGEGTHGTREFFQMKHRMLEFLVTRMGFTHFAIEATSPESDDMNRYVLTGEGDPAKLLSRLYFWTWNTREVADMITWMREWNTTAPAAQRVQFVGFDMQSPGASIDSVLSYFALVNDRVALEDATSRYACLSPYRNRGPTAGTSISQYAALSAATRSACAAGIQVVHDRLKSRRAEYEAASASPKYQASLHHARLVQQFEMMASSASGFSVRDAAMAENVAWLREQAGQDAKFALWAHNGHINSARGLMGGYLRDLFGDDYRTVGFAFGRGALTAVGQGSVSGLGTWTTSAISKGSIEAVFDATGKPRLLLDTRLIASGGAAAAPLAGPIYMRSIGSVFNPKLELGYFYLHRFPDDFDVLVYLAETSASVRLPFMF